MVELPSFKSQVPNLAPKVHQTMLTNKISTNQQAMFKRYYIIERYYFKVAGFLEREKVRVRVLGGEIG